MRKISMREAINEALHTAFNSDPTIFSAGEDIAVYGGQLRCSYDLIKNFGEKRIFDTPISETAIVGLSIGSSMLGLRPVVEISYIDFLGTCFDQVMNQAAKLRYMYGGMVSLPLVIRTQCGAGLGNGAQHSQSLEALLAHIPGIRVVMPSNAYDAKGLLLRAIRDNNPVVFIEHKALYKTKCEVPEEPYECDYTCSIKREGSDVTVIATGMVRRWKMHCILVWFCSTTWITSAIFSGVISMGFSQTMAFPALEAAMQTSPWVPLGTQTQTTSTLGSFKSS